MIGFQMDMCGNLGKSIQNFLIDRLIVARISGYLSSTMNVENCVPDGSILTYSQSL